jgi:hypothetical protein
VTEARKLLRPYRQDSATTCAFLVLQRHPVVPAVPKRQPLHRKRTTMWYVPQSEWWTLRQLEVQSIADKLPAPSAASSDADEPHCHGSSTSPTQRQHKPPLPPAALSPREHTASLKTAWLTASLHHLETIVVEQFRERLMESFRLRNTTEGCRSCDMKLTWR